ncbi:hypothetical protein GIS00_21830 [Nakamurella sp. YIM 132087]|uniref:F5/8 type C domain-containing protein n=1 Tax=Nakamurella alba TaxID=2665158 RepID=A0A7K1FR06_9ACTN|nr:glycoside hydrolase family 88 protein [Nakamurella alba]MTD16582.1 hypothetical protein [Nakamurella alba]
MPRTRTTGILLALAALIGGLTAGPVAPAGAAPAMSAPAVAAAVSSTPTLRSWVLHQTKLVANHYFSSSATNGWSWATYFQGNQALYGTAGDDAYLNRSITWGTANRWVLGTELPVADRFTAGQVYMDTYGGVGGRIAENERAVTARLSGDNRLTPFIDGMFMVLPDFAKVRTRTKNQAYSTKLRDYFVFARDDATGSFPGSGRPDCTGYPKGLRDPATGLWWRDCIAKGPAANGAFWGRGNGWVMASMARVLGELPATDPYRGDYVQALTTLAEALRLRQSSQDGMWRTDLANPARFPAPEVSASALIAFGMAYGIRAGLLDRSVYGPVVARAWNGIRQFIGADGTVSNCQDTGFEPGPIGRTQPFCAGAVVLAGSEISLLYPDLALGRPVTSASGGNPAYLVDGNRSAVWVAAAGYPRGAVVDLGSTRVVSSSYLIGYLDRAYKYRIDVATAGPAGPWRTVLDRTGNVVTGSNNEWFADTAARWVRLTVTGGPSGVNQVSIEEFGLYHVW